MNAGISSDHPSIHYYDSDYPSPDGLYPENFDSVTEYQGLAHDLARYREIAVHTGDPILELCCGTGRVAIPLAKDGHRVTAVDISTGMLAQLREKEISGRITILEQDITNLSLETRNFSLAIFAFNSLLCIPDFQKQFDALEAVSAHLRPGGLLLIDAVNPLKLNLYGDPAPKPFFTRKNPHNGNTYTRFATMGPLESDQRQRLYGWYDEIDSAGIVHRQNYSLYWRPIFRYEMELMLKQAGFAITEIHGGHRNEPFTAESPRMFIHATKK